MSFVCSLSSTDFAARRAHGASGADFGVRPVVEVVEPAYAADHRAALSVHDDGLVFQELSGLTCLGTGAGELVGQGRELVILGQHDAEIGVQKKGSASAESVSFDPAITLRYQKRPPVQPAAAPRTSNDHAVLYGIGVAPVARPDRRMTARRRTPARTVKGHRFQWPPVPKRSSSTPE